MKYKRPLPIPNSDFTNFWNGCRERQLKFKQCEKCEKVIWPESNFCQNCLSSKFVEIISKGFGKIYSYVVYHKAFHSDFRDELPYIAAIVELDEGPFILTNIVECPLSKVKCDLKVVLTWDEITEELKLPKFKLRSL